MKEPVGFMGFFPYSFKNHGYIPDLVRIMIRNLRIALMTVRVLFLFLITTQQGSEPAPSSSPCRMDGVWTGNNFLLDS
jgi:hypothetical protein